MKAVEIRNLSEKEIKAVKKDIARISTIIKENAMKNVQ